LLDFVFLSGKFYEDYKGCKEIEQKATRPYIRIQIEIDGLLFGAPLRSSINHSYTFWTDKANRCGVDFSKSVVITTPDLYIDKSIKPYIRPNEFDALRGKDHFLKEKLRKYIADYKKAKTNPGIPRNARLLQYSTLQYFEDYI